MRIETTYVKITTSRNTKEPKIIHIEGMLPNEVHSIINFTFKAIEDCKDKVTITYYKKTPVKLKKTTNKTVLDDGGVVFFSEN